MPRVSQEELVAALALALDTTGKRGPRNGSVAVSAGGARYAAGSVASQTHLLAIPSELAALMRAVHADDREIVEVASITEASAAGVSPLALKILADHAARTGTPITYRLYDELGAELFATGDARSALPFYTPAVERLPPLDRAPSLAAAPLDRAHPVEEALRQRALEGSGRNFPTYASASGYGAAVLAGETVYWGGQYSTPDHRLGVHAEAGVLVDALMQGARDITHIAVVSTKFCDTPVYPCGACRQLLTELARLVGADPIILSCAAAGPWEAHALADLIPLQWANTA